jgi:hypothetical protein
MRLRNDVAGRLAAPLSDRRDTGCTTGSAGLGDAGTWRARRRRTARSVPLPVAMVGNLMNELAAMAGCSAAREISVPLYVHTNSRMMSRGIHSPSCDGQYIRLPFGCDTSVLIWTTFPLSRTRRHPDQTRWPYPASVADLIADVADCGFVHRCGRRSGRARDRGGRALMASRCRRSSGGRGERAVLTSTGRRPSPLWGMGGPSEPRPERVTATGEPCGRARHDRVRAPNAIRGGVQAERCYGGDEGKADRRGATAAEASFSRGTRGTAPPTSSPTAGGSRCPRARRCRGTSPGTPCTGSAASAGRSRTPGCPSSGRTSRRCHRS